MSILNKKELCFFFHGSSGSTTGCGCTKDYLDSVSGVLTTILGTNGAPKYESSTGVLVNTIDGSEKDVQLTAASIGTAAGVLLRYETGDLSFSIEEIDIYNTSYVKCENVDKWAGECYFGSCSKPAGRSVLSGVDTTVNFNASGQCFIDKSGTLLTYDIYEVTDGTTLTLDDGGAYYDTYGSSSGICAPDTFDGDATVGGAMNDLQDTIDDYSTGDDYSVWIFVGSDPNPTTSISFTSVYSGDIGNNTRVYLVGYLTDAYDCLPAGFGYFPDSIGDGANYKNAFETAKIGNVIATQDNYKRKFSISSVPQWNSAVELTSQAEAIWIMGFVFYGNTNDRYAIMINCAEYGSIHVRHCAQIIDYAGSSYFLRVDEGGSGGSILDCYGYHCAPLQKVSGVNTSEATFQLAYSVFTEIGNINPDYWDVIIHDCVLHRWQYGISIVTAGNITCFNNVFYMDDVGDMATQTAVIHLNGVQGGMVFYNNIVAVDLSQVDSGFDYIIINTGGELRFCDYNLIYDLNGGNWPSGDFVNLSINTNWKGTFGEDFDEHTLIDVDPLFVAPSDYDFRLKPQSPCIGAGRPDFNGNPTNIGLDQRQIIGAKVEYHV